MAKYGGAVTAVCGDRTIPESVEGVSTALESNMVGNDTAASREYYECDPDCRLHFAHSPAMLLFQRFDPPSAGSSLIQDGRLIRQHCPKIAPGAANRHPYVKPDDGRSFVACLGGADCLRGGTRAGPMRQVQAPGNAAVPHNPSTSHAEEDRCAPL
jgi:hypothetical protein